MMAAKRTDIPKIPGVDLSDPKTLAGAKAVATRRNNKFRRDVERRLPLFREEVMAEYVPATPESVIEQRRSFQEEFAVRLREMKRTDIENIRKVRAEIRAAVDDTEFWRILREVATQPYPRSRWMRWTMAKRKIENRNTPLTPAADLVFAWLEAESEPVSHHAIWRSRGDGLTKNEVMHALHELADKDLVRLCGSRRETIDEDGSEMTVAVWEVTNKR